MGNDALSRSIDRRAIGRIGLVACLAPVASAAGCSVSPAASTPSKSLVRVAALKGPTGVGMVYLMAAQQGGTAANDYTFSVTDSPDEVVAKITSRDVDVAAVPTNLGAVLYNKMSRGVQVLAVNTLGVMYLMELGDTVQSMADLKGRTVYATGQGSNPEYVLRFLLQKNGIDPDTDVQLVYKSEHAELATLTAAGQVTLALLPEPFVTTVRVKNPNVRVALDLTTEWAKVVTDGSRLMMGAVIARRDFVTKNPAAVSAFLTEYRSSIERAKADAHAAAALCQQFAVISSSAVAEAAMSRMSLTYVAGDEMRAGLTGCFQVLYAANPKSVGGAVPDAGFYATAR